MLRNNSCNFPTQEIAVSDSSSIEANKVVSNGRPYYRKPGVLSAEDYGYGEIQDSTDKSYSKDLYGYDNAVPDSSCPHVPHKFADRSSSSWAADRPNGRMGRRSSMKQSGMPRRSSISYRGEVVNCLPTGRAARRRQSIGFDDALTEVHHVEPTKSLAQKPEELWFQQHEFDMIREKAILLTNIAKSTQTKMSMDAPVENKKLCFRGLESHIDSENVEYEQHLAWKSVFLEQYHQMAKGDFNEDLVANLYEMAAMPARARALQRAQADNIEAQKHTRCFGRRVGRRHSTMA